MDLTDSLDEVLHPLTNVLQESPCMNTVFLIYLSTLTNLFCSRTVRPKLLDISPSHGIGELVEVSVSEEMENRRSCK